MYIYTHIYIYNIYIYIYICIYIAPPAVNCAVAIVMGSVLGVYCGGLSSEGEKWGQH